MKSRARGLGMRDKKFSRNLGLLSTLIDIICRCFSQYYRKSSPINPLGNGQRWGKSALFMFTKNASGPLNKIPVNISRLERLKEEIAVYTLGLTKWQIPLLKHTCAMCIKMVFMSKLLLLVKFFKALTLQGN